MGCNRIIIQKLADLASLEAYILMEKKQTEWPGGWFVFHPTNFHPNTPLGKCPRFNIGLSHCLLATASCLALVAAIVEDLWSNGISDDSHLSRLMPKHSYQKNGALPHCFIINTWSLFGIPEIPPLNLHLHLDALFETRLSPSLPLWRLLQLNPDFLRGPHWWRFQGLGLACTSRQEGTASGSPVLETHGRYEWNKRVVWQRRKQQGEMSGNMQSIYLAEVSCGIVITYLVFTYSQLSHENSNDLHPLVTTGLQLRLPAFQLWHCHVHQSSWILRLAPR